MESEGLVSGQVVYDPNDPEEVQDFCWHMKEEGVPSREVFELVKLLETKRLLDTDKISVSLKILLIKFNEFTEAKLDKQEFFVVLKELMNVRVEMVDHGKESDFYFIHA